MNLKHLTEGIDFKFNYNYNNLEIEILTGKCIKYFLRNKDLSFSNYRFKDNISNFPNIDKFKLKLISDNLFQKTSYNKYDKTNAIGPVKCVSIGPQKNS